MRKIVIVTHKSIPAGHLFLCLNKLWPDCEVQVANKGNDVSFETGKSSFNHHGVDAERESNG